MTDTYDYFLAHAREAIVKARSLPVGQQKSKQRVVARVYHILAKANGSRRARPMRHSLHKF
jgi:hypothetical protein